jgi:hypothetical protein
MTLFQRVSAIFEDREAADRNRCVEDERRRDIAIAGPM